MKTADEINRERKDEYFRSLIAPPKVKKKRSCLNCGRVFVSESAGHRRCCHCDEKVESLSHRCEEVYI
jgi:hypothetical protein